MVQVRCGYCGISAVWKPTISKLVADEPYGKCPVITDMLNREAYEGAFLEHECKAFRLSLYIAVTNFRRQQVDTSAR
jgi:hypothetical protein